MTTDLLTKEGVLGRNVNFDGSYQFMQTVGD